MKRACVIGWPIDHSRSPRIHGFWLAQYGIAGEYTRRAVPDAASLDAVMADLRSGALAGCNVTVPHKTAVLGRVDIVDDRCRAIGAVNTLWVEAGRIHATNTDAPGFLAHLDASHRDWPRDRPALVYGAGGAARAVQIGRAHV